MSEYIDFENLIHESLKHALDVGLGNLTLIKASELSGVDLNILDRIKLRQWELWRYVSIKAIREGYPEIIDQALLLGVITQQFIYKHQKSKRSYRKMRKIPRAPLGSPSTAPRGNASEFRKSQKTKNAEIRQSMLDAGVALAAEKGIWNVVHRELSEAIGTAYGTVAWHLGGASATRDAVAHEAVRVENQPVLAQLIAHKHPSAKDISTELRERTARAFVESYTPINDISECYEMFNEGLRKYEMAVLSLKYATKHGIMSLFERSSRAEIAAQMGLSTKTFFNTFVVNDNMLAQVMYIAIDRKNTKVINQILTLNCDVSKLIAPDIVAYSMGKL